MGWLDYTLNYLVLGLYVVMMIAIALYTRNRSKTLNDFLLAGKKGLGGWMSAFAYGTTYFSAVIFIGYAGNFGWDFGLAATFIGVGNALIGSLLAWKVLARRTKVMTGILGAKTMPELFEARYHSKHIKLFSALIMFVFLIPYSASVYQGLGYLFEIVFGIDVLWCILIMAALTALYLIFGGYFATALSDFIQGLIMIAGVVIMTAFAVHNLGGADMAGIAESFQQLFESNLGFLPSAEGGFDSNLFNLVVIVLLTSFGVWGLPQSVHKFYAVRDKKSIRQATVISTVFALVIGCGAYFVGSLARFYNGGVRPPQADAIVPNMLVQILPAGVLGLIVVLVLSASMSTLSSLSLSGASAVSVDVYKGYVKKDASDQKVNLLMKLACLGFVVVSVLLAVFNVSAIVTLMSLSWGTIAGCFIGPYVYGLYSKRVNKCGAYASLISGLVVTVTLIFVFGGLSAPASFGELVSRGVAHSPLIGVIAMALSMIVTPLFSLIRPKEKHAEEDAALLSQVKNAKID